MRWLIDKHYDEADPVGVFQGSCHINHRLCDSLREEDLTVKICHLTRYLI